MIGHMEFPGASYDAWKTRSPDDEYYQEYPDEEDDGPDERPMIECCPRCGGDGGGEVWTGYDPRDGAATGYWSECQTCDGTGSVEEALVIRTLEDIEEESAQEDQAR